MSKKIYYFVDYENVHEAGLAGMNTLPKDSEVHLFYSQNANKLNLDLLRFVKAKVRVHKVKPGKQSLDMQMVSYLGYCIGDEEEDGTYILVSKDTDYANTVLFWQEEGIEVRVQPAILEEKNALGMERALKSVKITRRGRRGGKKTSAAAQEVPAGEAPEAAEKPLPAAAPQPAEPAAAAPAEPVPAAEKADAVPKTEEPVKEEKAKSTRRGRRGGRGRKSQAENAQTQDQAKPEETTVPETAVTAGKPEEQPVPKQEAKPAVKPAAKTEAKPEQKPAPVRNNAVPAEPAKVTVTVHDVPMVTHDVPQTKPEKSQTASRVQAALAEKKTDAAVARKVVSIVQKHEGAKNSRQAIYLEIRKTFGQKMGVDLYNQIKPLLK